MATVLQPSLQADAQPARSSFRSGIFVVSLFWLYAALTGVLWGRSMEISLANRGLRDFFTPWDERLLQYALLYPLLIGALFLSHRLGWRPLWRTAPLHLLIGIAFALLARPALLLIEILMMPGFWASADVTSVFPISTDIPALTSYPWLASTMTFLLPYAFCLALLEGVDIHHRYRDTLLRSATLEQSLSVERMATLRSQLSPHTLFNLLHTIRGLVTWDPPLAQKMIVQLSDLLRQLLHAGQSNLSTLGEELRFTRLYLELQRERFPDRLDVDFPETVADGHLFVPSLILQPLVENAVVHGLADPQAHVQVTVQAFAESESLVLRVINTLTPGRRPSRQRTSGIGIRNVRERLALQFGERASFSSAETADSAWIAEIRIPTLRAVGEKP